MNNEMEDNDSRINSLVGENSWFRGDIEVKGFIRIDGNFSGSIKTESRLLVGKTGRVRSNIEAESVIIGGIVKGNIYASVKVVILETGMVIGNITAPRITVDEGVILNGSCSITGSDIGNERNRSGFFSIEWEPDTAREPSAWTE